MHTAASPFMSRQPVQSRAPYLSHKNSQGPPSPPMEDHKCSLPSISNLLGLADAGSPTNEHPPTSRQHSPRADATPQPQRHETYIQVDSRPGSGYAKSSYPPGLPPTPPMSTDASFDGYHSPSNKLAPQAPNTTHRAYYYETTPPLEADIQRQPAPAVVRRPAPSAPLSYQQPPVTTYVNQQPAANFYPPQHPAPTQGIYYQRPLPQTYPPPVSMTMAAPAPTGASPWQHHHYLNPSGAAAFPQSQDRYICATCNKAFSRPSSLRIHSHSHTGEKPFKCPHSGCGKAFSVRSNMKRHERGCHSFEFNGTASVLRH